MKILLNSAEVKKELNNIQSLGFVPTMGSIHKGHQSLIKRSKNECKKTIVSIFVNPTQFNNKVDFKKYPRKTNDDLKILQKMDVDFVFLPKENDIYKKKRVKQIRLVKKHLILCAKYRKGHFEGVLDVMDRLTKLIQPKKIYMGEKDLQQYYLVKKFLKKKYNTNIIKCPTIRDSNDIALSSRNSLLNKKHKRIASKIIFELREIKKEINRTNKIGNILKIKSKYLTDNYNIIIEYLELRNFKNLKKSFTLKNSKLFIAYYINKIRLIDNL